MKGHGETLNVGGLSYFPEKNATMEHHLGLQKNKISFQLSLSLVNGWCHSLVPTLLTYFSPGPTKILDTKQCMEN